MERNGMSLTTPFTNGAPRRPPIGRTASHDWVAEWLLCMPIVAITLIVKFAIPAGHKQIHFPLVVLMGTVLAGFFLGRLRLEMTNLRAYLMMVTILFITQIIDLPGGATHFSFKSLALIIVLMSCYAFEMEPGTTRPDIAIRFFRNVMLIIALCGIAQFSIQFVVHNTRFIFPIEENFPKGWVTSNYANMLPLYYGSTLWKSNGLFLLEPSFFSQYCALAFLLELLTFRKLWRMAILGGGLVAAFSGSGFAMLALAAGIYALEKRQFALVLAVIIGAVGVYFIIDSLNILHETHLDTLIKRFGELTGKQTSSSGFARFIGPFYLLNQFVWPDFLTAFFGLGAGSISSMIIRASYPSWDPTWAKITLEYGLVGFIAFMALICRGVFRATGSIYLKIVLLFQFVVLSGAVPAQSHVWFVVFLVWPKANNEVAETERDREMSPGTTPAMQTA
jgi:hypothetical protein